MIQIIYSTLLVHFIIQNKSIHLKLVRGLLEQRQYHNTGSLHSSALFSFWDYTQLASYTLNFLRVFCSHLLQIFLLHLIFSRCHLLHLIFLFHLIFSGCHLLHLIFFYHIIGSNLIFWL